MMRCLCSLLVVATVACPRAETPPPVDASTRAAPSAASSVPDAVDAGLAAYPRAWIDAAFFDRPSACARLVYKDGCRSLRRGRVESRVTLDEAGRVVDVVITRNTVTVDASLVEDCVRRDLAARAFRAPAAGMSRQFTHVVVLADRC